MAEIFVRVIKRDFCRSLNFHLDESESLGLSGLMIAGDVHILHLTELAKDILQSVSGGSTIKITNKKRLTLLALFLRATTTATTPLFLTR